MKRQALLGSAAIVIGVASIALLAPQAASALDFTFSFEQAGEGVSGLITGLVEGTNSCLVQAGPCFVTLLDAGATGVPTGNYFGTNYSFGLPGSMTAGFIVTGSIITDYA